MCGIAGKFNLRPDEPVTVETIAGMCGVLWHRGPDDEGIYLDGSFGMGMRRLSIIDLLSGKQAIQNEDGSILTGPDGRLRS